MAEWIRGGFAAEFVGAWFCARPHFSLYLEHIGNHTSWVATKSSLPFKGRARVGMGYRDVVSSFYRTIKTHPHPNLPLEGEGTKGRKLKSF